MPARLWAHVSRRRYQRRPLTALSFILAIPAGRILVSMTLRIALAQIAPRSAPSMTTSRGITSSSRKRARAAPASSCSPSSGSPATCSRTSPPRSRCDSTTRGWRSSPRATARPLGGRLVRGGIGRPPPVHRRRAAGGRRDPARPPQGVPADVRPVRRAAVLRAGRRDARDAVAARRRASGSRCARTSGTCQTPQLLALDGAQLLINVSSSPGRDLAARNEVGLGTATSWRTLMRTYAQLTTSFVVFVNRVGRRRVDDVLGRLGGHRAVAASRSSRAPLFDEGLYLVDVEPGRRPTRADRAAAAARRAPRAPGARAAADHRRAGGAGRRLDRRRRAPSPASTWRLAARADVGLRQWDGALDGPIRSGRAADERRGSRCRRTTPGRRCSSCPTSWRSTRTSPAGSSPASSAASCARPASSAACSGCRAASTRRSWRTSSPRRSAPTSCCAC